MSELEARHAFDVYEAYTKTGDDDAAQVYIKSEADKVIAELKAQKAQAEDDCAYWKKKYNDCKRELDLLKDTNAFYNGGR